MKKKKVIIITGSIVAVLLVIGAQFFADWYKFYSAEKSIEKGLLELQSQYSLSDIKTEKYCNYTHQKYSKGVLGCDVIYSFESNTQSLDGSIFDDISNFGWDNRIEVTESINRYSKIKYLRYETYDHKGLSCSCSKKDVGNTFVYELQCGGPALREWYPVRE